MAIGKDHFDLLRHFGRSTVSNSVSDKEKEKLWELSCKAAKLPPAPYNDVVAEWKKFIVGDSVESNLAIATEIDPEYVAVGVTYKKALVATHTTKTAALLRKVLSLWRKAFDDDEAFLTSVHQITLSVLKPKKQKK